MHVKFYFFVTPVDGKYVDAVLVTWENSYVNRNERLSEWDFYQ